MELAGILGGFATALEKHSDKRTKNYLLLHGLTPLMAILSVYLYFCMSAGPRLMKSRPPLHLKKIIFVYNLLNIAVSLWLVNEVVQTGWLSDYSYRCQPIDYSESPTALRTAKLVWVYFMVKIVELLDTVFFVLRKKDNQVTHLHLYHHTSTPIVAWIAAKFIPGGEVTFDIFLNTNVHVIMYSYYLLASLGPQYHKYLWWKKYLTGIQIVQLILILLHHLQVFFTDCNFPKPMAAVMALTVSYNLYHFILFFKRSYSKNRNKKHSLE